MCKILRGNGNDLTNSNPVHGNGSADRCPDWQSLLSGSGPTLDIKINQYTDSSWLFKWE